MNSNEESIRNWTESHSTVHSQPCRTEWLSPDEDVSVSSCPLNLTFVFWQKIHYWDQGQRCCLLSLEQHVEILFYLILGVSGYKGWGKTSCIITSEIDGSSLRKSHTRKWSVFLITRLFMLLKGHFCFLTMNIVDSEVTHTVALDHHTHSFGEQRSTFTKTRLRA